MVGAQFRQPGAKVLVNGNIAQRGRVSVAIVDGGKGKILIVRRRNHHHAGVFPPLELGEARCRHRAREHIAGVRANQRHQRPLNLRHGVVRQKAVNHLGEFFGVGGVKTSRHARRRELSASRCGRIRWLASTKTVSTAIERKCLRFFMTSPMR